MLEVTPEQYSAVRANPRQFLVLPGHVVTEVETVVAEHDGYVVVEKLGGAGSLAEASLPAQGAISDTG
jgi:hypothetical protein